MTITTPATAHSIYGRVFAARGVEDTEENRHEVQMTINDHARVGFADLNILTESIGAVDVLEDSAWLHADNFLDNRAFDATLNAEDRTAALITLRADERKDALSRAGIDLDDDETATTILTERFKRKRALLTEKLNIAIVVLAGKIEDIVTEHADFDRDN